MAPGAELVSLRVLGADGYGLVSDVVLALEWVIKNKDRYRLRVVNLSLGLATKEPYRTAPMALAVERAVASGLVVVASAGNYGKLDDGTPIVGVVVSPGHTPGALTVGRDEHARHGRAVRRCGGELQLARSGGRSGRRIDVGAQAGSRRAGQRDHRRGGS